MATRLEKFLVSESIILQGLALEGSILPWWGIGPLANANGGKFSGNTKEQSFQIREVLDRPPNIQGEHQSLVARKNPGTRDKDV